MARVIRRGERVGDFTLVAMADAHVYERIGHGYRAVRSPDPRLAERIRQALGDARTVLNVGAGTGSYDRPTAGCSRSSPRDEVIE